MNKTEEFDQVYNNQNDKIKVNDSDYQKKIMMKYYRERLRKSKINNLISFSN